jgi:hypothetical protein
LVQSSGYGFGPGSNYPVEDTDLLKGLLVDDREKVTPHDYSTPHDDAVIPWLQEEDECLTATTDAA